MVKMERTKIQISTDTWRNLNAMKKPGESFDDVIRRIIDNIGLDSKFVQIKVDEEAEC